MVEIALRAPPRHQAYAHAAGRDWFRLTLEALIDNGTIHDIYQPLQNLNLSTDDLLYKLQLLHGVIRVHSLRET